MWPELSLVLLPLLPPVTDLTLETCPTQLSRSPETLCAGSSFSPPVREPLNPNFFLTYTSTLHHRGSPHSPLASYPFRFLHFLFLLASFIFLIPPSPSPSPSWKQHDAEEGEQLSQCRELGPSPASTLPVTRKQTFIPVTLFSSPCERP